jgi:hypothetical protein
VGAAQTAAPAISRVLLCMAISQWNADAAVS